MKKQYLGRSAVLGAVLVLSACIDEGGGSGGGANLTGVWRGVYEYVAGGYSYHQAVVTVDGYTITDLDIIGVATNLTGSISAIQTNIYGFTTSSGGDGGFMTDSAAQYAGFVDLVSGDFGVVQKGAASLPQNYVQSDVAGTWSGYSVNLDSVGNVVQSGASNGTVTCPPVGDCSFSGSDLNGSFSGTFPATYFSRTAGWYGGLFSNSIGAGTVYAFLSPDKRFAAVYGCQGSNLPPSTFCTYSIWNKQ